MPGPDDIKIKMPMSPSYADGLTPQGTDLVWVWDVATGVLRKAPISSLPFSTDGGGGGASSSPSPFIITNDSEQYDFDGTGDGTITISDVRLLNKSLYPVATTQFGGGELRLAQLTYVAVDPDDDTKGQVKISGFELGDGEHITIYIPGSGSAEDPVYNQLLTDVEELKRITAVFKPTALGPNGGKVWWPSALAIPAGWQECVAMRGLMPAGRDTGQAEFTTLGASLGLKSVKLIAANIPQLPVERPKKIADVDRGNTGGVSAWSLDDVETVQVGTADGAMVNVKTLPPYKVGIWIEYVGL